MIRTTDFTHPKGQQGLGLIEVLVSLILLSIAFLGFSALQVRSLQATDESLMRSQAMTVMRSGAEMMRANNGGIATFVKVVNDKSTSTSTTVGNRQINKNSCYSTKSKADYCTAEQIAARDALVFRDYLQQNDLQAHIANCPGRSTSFQARQCMIVAWDNTVPNMGRSGPQPTGDQIGCANNDGVYNVGSQCFIMEAY